MIFVWLAAFLLFTVLIGLLRIERGPSGADRMLAAQLFATAGVGMALLLAEGLGQPVLRDVALVVALLAAVASVAFVKRAWDWSRLPGDSK